MPLGIMRDRLRAPLKPTVRAFGGVIKWAPWWREAAPPQAAQRLMVAKILTIRHDGKWTSVSCQIKRNLILRLYLNQTKFRLFPNRLENWRKKSDSVRLNKKHKIASLHSAEQMFVMSNKISNLIWLNNYKLVN